MCARQVYRNLLITLLLLAFLSPTSHLFAATRGIQVVSKKGQSLYLYKDYQAVVIGVSDYDHWPKLPKAVMDSQQVAGKLREMGFKVKLIANPDSRQLKSTLNEIARRLGSEKNRALLLYYAGHGETTKLADGTELGYIIPKDCPLQILDPLGFDSKAVSMKEIEMLALKVRSKHMLAVFDSCFSGSLFALSRAAPTDISEKSAKPVRQFMTAGGADETVPDRSIFKVCFLQGLDGDADYNRDGYVTGSELGLYLQTKVINYTRGAQHPQYGKINNPYLDRGDFVFVLENAKRQVAKTKPSPELAYIPKAVAVEKVSLRERPKWFLEKDLRKMVLKYGFYDDNLNPEGSFANDFVDNGDGTITDRATGLMWQKSGSSKARTCPRTRILVKRLNKGSFAGYSDWRLPTIEELASLLEREKINGLHINAVFNKEQKSCWSVDMPNRGSMGNQDIEYETWVVDFSKGIIRLDRWSDSKVVITFNSPLELRHYFRAVRSVK